MSARRNGARPRHDGQRSKSRHSDRLPTQTIHIYEQSGGAAAPRPRLTSRKRTLGVRVLGPVEVAGAQGLVALGGRQRRAILAVLLANGAAGCTADALVEALWNDDLPSTAGAVLHSQISRLRRLLEPDRPARAPARILRLTESGYLLDLDAHDLDADRFERQLEKGRAALEDGDPATAKSALTTGLDSWRGAAYGEFAEHPAVSAAAADLEEKRLAAQETLAEARLQLGEHADLVGELESRVRDHPYREQIWGQLVLAQYRCGRQADALAAYQRCRSGLIDELGIEPGPALQQLNEAVLLQSPGLDWHPAHRTRLAPPPRPTRQIPPPAPRTSFVGRDAELAEIGEALTTHRLITIIGPAGVGKTRLAIEVATRVAADFHHGVAFCDLAGLAGEEQVAEAIANAVGVEELIEAADDPLVDHLVSRELLLVVDNADHALDGVAGLGDRLLAACPRLVLLVTSREPLRVNGERLAQLAPLPTDGVDGAAIQLFVDRASLSAHGLRLDPNTLVDVCRRIDGLPLAIELAASRLRSVPIDHLASGLDDRLSAIADTLAPRGSTPHRTLRDVIERSVALLDETQRAMLRRTAVFSGGWTSRAATTVCALDADPVEALAGLVERSLVQLEHREEASRYRLLETIRADGLGRLVEHDELEHFRARHLRWCLSLVQPDPGHGEDPAEVEPLAAEIDNVVAALTWSLDGHEVVTGARLAVAAAPIWTHSGRFGEGRRWLELAAAATPPEAHEHRLTLRWLGWTLARQGDFGSARLRLRDALRLAEAAGDEDVRRDVEVLLGAVEIDAGDLATGVGRLRRRHEPANDQVEPRRRAYRCYALGSHALQEGRLDDAVDQLRSAAREARDAGMWHTLVRVLTSLAQAESGRRRFHRADEALAEALVVARRHRLLGLMPRILGVRAVQTARRGDWSAGGSLFEEALAAARSLGDRRVELITLTNLGVVDLREDRPAAALKRLEEALELARRAEDERVGLMISADLTEAIVAATHDTERALALAVDTVVRSQRAGIRIATISGLEAAAFMLVDRNAPGDLEGAGVLLGAATAEREALDLLEDVPTTSPIVQARARIDAALGSAAGDADQRGRELGLETAAEQLLAEHGDAATASDAAATG